MQFNAFHGLAAMALVLSIAGCTSHVSPDSSFLAQRPPLASVVNEDGGPGLGDSIIFALERDADCGTSAITDPPLADMACAGHLPEHLVEFLRSMPDTHLFLNASEREEIARSPQSFKVVSGLGERPDVVAVISHSSLFWIRSFEGPDPNVTVYMVYGPDCDASSAFDRYPAKRKCRSEDSYLRDFTLYRVSKGRPPEDVTSTLMPPLPRMSRKEQLRYGVYLRPEGEAREADIKLDVSRLVRTPVLRWVLRPVQEGDYQPPDMPKSDPRAFMDYYWGNRNVAHFGFLVWNGKRMELRETVSEAFWPCRASSPQSRNCDAGYDGVADRYLTHVATERPGGPDDESTSRH